MINLRSNTVSRPASGGWRPAPVCLRKPCPSVCSVFRASLLFLPLLLRGHSEHVLQRPRGNRSGPRSDHGAQAVGEVGRPLGRPALLKTVQEAGGKSVSRPHGGGNQRFISCKTFEWGV